MGMTIPWRATAVEFTPRAVPAGQCVGACHTCQTMLLRRVALGGLLALAVAPSLACSAEAPSEDAPLLTGEDDIVDVPQTPVERQSIGNCWLYSHASWIESMQLAATGQAFDASQSYWTYWHWFAQIASGTKSEISTSGNFGTANAIVRSYGLVPEKAFVPADTLDEMSMRQKQALDALNLSLKEGALKDPRARRDRKIVRKEMDRAWGLSPEVSAMLDKVFGEGATKSFGARGTPADPAGTPIVRAQDFEVSYPSAPGRPASKKKLTQAMGEWRQVWYPRSGASAQRAFQQRVQRALHDAQPVIITWFVDFSALENRSNDRRGSFNMQTLADFGPGRQGSHMTVLEDYEATLSDGTVLRAGVTLDPKNADHAKLLARALEPQTKISFFRVKNSWGSARPDRAFAPGMPGYHDLWIDYLNGPIQQCAKKNGETDTTNCQNEMTPLQDVVLPPGY